MPDEIVPNDLHVALEAELHVAVRRLERVAVGRRLRRLELQRVLRADLVELLCDDFDGGDIGAIELPLVDGDADNHALRHHVLQRDVLLCRRRNQKNETGSRDKRSHGTLLQMRLSFAIAFESDLNSRMNGNMPLSCWSIACARLSTSAARS